MEMGRHSEKEQVDPEVLLHQAFRITSRELDRYEKRRQLAPNEAQALQGYTRVLLTATRKQEREDDEELDGMSDEEIAKREAEVLARAKGKG